MANEKKGLDTALEEWDREIVDILGRAPVKEIKDLEDYIRRCMYQDEDKDLCLMGCFAYAALSHAIIKVAKNKGIT